MQVDADLTYATLSGTHYGVSLHGSDKIHMAMSSNEARLFLQGGVIANNASLGTKAKGDSVRGSIGWDLNNVGSTIDTYSGVLVDTSAVNPTGINKLVVGHYDGFGGDLYHNGCVLNIIYYPQRLVDNILEHISSRENSND